MDWTRMSEAQLRASIPVFINSYEQLTYLRDTVDWFHLHGFQCLYVVEQGSTYAPLQAYLKSADLRSRAMVMPLHRHIGPRRAVRYCAQLNGFGTPMIFTDPDLALPSPPDLYFARRMIELGRKYDVVKVGLALDVFDETRVNQDMVLDHKDTVFSAYSRFFDTPLERNVYQAGVDTTFFMYVPRKSPRPRDILQSQPRIPAVRIGGSGFLADHRPWLFDHGMPPEEEAHYAKVAGFASTLYGRGAKAEERARAQAG